MYKEYVLVNVFSSSTFKFSWFDIVAAGRQKLAIYWTSWLWGIACNYLRIIAHRNTISPTYNVSCCKISVKFITWLRIKRKKQKHIFSKIIELVLFFSWTCWPFKTVFYHVFGFCVINGLINRRKICRYFSYSPIYRLPPANLISHLMSSSRRSFHM